MRTRTKVLCGLVAALVMGLAVQPLLATKSSADRTRVAATSTASTASSPTRPPVSSPTAPTAISVGGTTAADLVAGLGDSLTYRPASWFRRTCRSGDIGTCINAGVTGDTTTQMYARLGSEVLDQDPDAIVLMGGANDIRHGAGTTQIVERLKRIVKAARADGVPVVIATVPPQNLHGAAVLALNRAIRRYAAAAGLPLLDMYGSVGTSRGRYRSGMSDDGLHPNRAGFARMASVAELDLPDLLVSARSIG